MNTARLNMDLAGYGHNPHEDSKAQVNSPGPFNRARFEVPEKGCYDEDCEGERVEYTCGCCNCTINPFHDRRCPYHAKEERAEYLADVEKER